MFFSASKPVAPLKQVLIGAFISIGLSISSSAAGDSNDASDSNVKINLDELAIVADHQQFADRAATNFLDGIIESFQEAESANHIEQDYVNLAKQIAERVFTSDRIKASIYTHLQQELNPSDYDPLIALHRSDLRKREQTAEKSARIRLESPEGDDIFEAYVAIYQASTQFAARSELIKDLHESLNVSELTAQLLTDTQIANLIGLTYSQPLESRADLDDVIASIQAQQPTIEKMLETQIANYRAYIYRGFNTEDIKALTKLYSTDEYTRYFATVMQGLRAALTEMSIEFGDKLGSAAALAESSQEL